MNKPFKNSDFKMGHGLSLRWIVCDELNKRFSTNKKMQDDLLSWLNKGEVVKSEWLQYCTIEWLKLLSVLDFLHEIKILDDDVFKTVTKEINDYLNLIYERM